MNFFRRSDSLLLLPLLLCCCSAPTHAQNDAMVGQSITWQPARSPFTPNASNGAIMGGPGADPNPGAPMYICRARVQNSMVPGKWVQGNCNVAFGGSEQIMRSYEVAYGNARWGAYRGTTYGLAQMGRDIDGSPLFSCRVHYVASGTDYGYQPGKLVPNGTCHIPFGGSEVIQSPPFQVLYATGGGRPPVNPPYNPYPPYPYPPPYYPYPPQVQPYPACNPSTPGVIKDLTSGWWVGPGCSPSDGQGRIMEPKYPPGQQPPNYAPPPPPYQPGPSSVTWQPAQKPFVPGSNAIMGGPGNGPKPDSPLYICRVTYNSNLFPGKWVQGECHFSDDAGKEQSSKTYEVAIGSAQWRDFDGNIGALVPGGVAADGTPLYICRKQISSWGSKKGFQPGYLENGRCHIPYTTSIQPTIRPSRPSTTSSPHPAQTILRIKVQSPRRNSSLRRNPLRRPTLPPRPTESLSPSSVEPRPLQEQSPSPTAPPAKPSPKLCRPIPPRNNVWRYCSRLPSRPRCKFKCSPTAPASASSVSTMPST